MLSATCRFGAAALAFAVPASASITAIGFELGVQVDAAAGGGDSHQNGGVSLPFYQRATAQAGGLTATAQYHFRGDAQGVVLEWTFAHSIPSLPVGWPPPTTGNAARAYTVTNGAPPVAVQFTLDAPTPYTFEGSFQSNVLSEFDVSSTPRFFPDYIGLNAENTFGPSSGVLAAGSYTIYYEATIRNGFGSPIFNAGQGTGRLRLTLGVPPGCYANCDNSTTAPVLNVLDFTCFLNKFAAGDSYANCDNSTTPPVLNVLDFICFLNRFAAGCP